MIEELTIGKANFFTIFAAMLSAMGLFFAIDRYLLKKGVSCRGSFSTRYTIKCSDAYVSSVFIENLKDKPLIIHGIYLRVARNVFIELSKFDGTPMILKSYEAKKIRYEPIEHYEFNLFKINLNKMLKRSNGRLYISSSHGKTRVRPLKRIWDPANDQFFNRSTIVPRAARLSAYGKAWGSNTAYVVKLTTKDNTMVVPIMTDNFGRRIFKNFDVDDDAMQSATALGNLLNRQKESGNLGFEKFEIFDLRSERKRKQNSPLPLRDIGAIEEASFFDYYLKNPLFGRFEQIKMRLDSLIKH